MEQFISDVTTGELVSCEYVKLAVKRHQKDLKNGKKRGLFFSPERANHAIQFISMMKHTKGDWKGKPFNMQPFQAFIIGSIFGWLRKEIIDGEERTIRRFKLAYNEVARKNGKTELAAAIGNYMLIADGEGGSEVYTAATKKPQAALCLKQAASMMHMLKKDSKSIDKLVGISASKHSQTMYVLSTESKFEALAADSDKEDGLNPHCGIIDEYHAHPTSELMEVIKTGMGGRLQPLLFIITTAGFNKLSPCFRLRKTIIDILRGHKEDDSTFGVIFTLDDPEQWTDEKEWIKANPNIGKSPYWHYMKDQFINAVNQGGEAMVQFKTKNLNIWENTAATWIADKFWNKAKKTFTPDEFKGAKIWVGLDLASVKDITAIRVIAELEDKLYSWGKYYLPETAVEPRTKEGTAYKDWAKQGFLTVTPGNVADISFVMDDLIYLSDHYQLQSIQYDPWNARDMAVTLYNQGLNMVEHSQWLSHFAFPTKQYEKFIMEGKYYHDGNPVQTWMLSNVELKRDSNGNYKPDKNKSTEKIDGIVADIMALSGWLHDNYVEGKEISPEIYFL
jgi:phage terminase large subunit-like protein